MSNIPENSANRPNRRDFLNISLATLAAGTLPYAANAQETARKPRASLERLRVGAIGMRYQGTVIAKQAEEFADIAAIADVDRHVREQARASFGSTPRIYEDYRELLDKGNVDVVTIGAPDHWHTKMLADACRAGKDVYCEKPLTLTIDEGKFLTRVVEETGRVVQVGSWQRSDHRFRLAVEMVHQGRIGKLRKVTVVLGKNQAGGPFAVKEPPAHINWDLWQGQTPDVPYIPERCHYTFRWWYEYSGGQMTDWGAHHLDIAHWGTGFQNSGPVLIEGSAKYPDVSDGFNVALDFYAKYTYADGVTLEVLDHGRNGVLFEGDGGRIFVNRGTLAGTPVDDLTKNPLPREKFTLYEHDNLSRPERMGKLDAITNHMGNFFDCIETRNTPLSDVRSQHRSVSVCHLGNIAMRLGRKLEWDPDQEQFKDDPEANSDLKREQRAGFEIA